MLGPGVAFLGVCHRPCFLGGDPESGTGWVPESRPCVRPTLPLPYSRPQTSDNGIRHGTYPSAGASTKVTISVNSSQLGLWSLDNRWVVEPGKFMIKVGTSDETFMNTTLTVQ